MAILPGFPMCNTLHVGGINPDCLHCSKQKPLSGVAFVQAHTKEGLPIMRGKFQEAYPLSWPGRIYSGEAADKLWSNLKKRMEATQ
jgi:hypothetical protein